MANQVHSGAETSTLSNQEDQSFQLELGLLHVLQIFPSSFPEKDVNADQIGHQHEP